MVRKTIIALFLLIVMAGCAKKEQPALEPVGTATPAVIRTTAPTPTTMVYPTTNPELLQFTVHIQAVRVAEDDGQNLANISPDQIGKLVSKANEIFAMSGIRLMFDPQTDVDIIQSSIVANMLGQNTMNWQTEAQTADELAAKYPNKLTVFFRQKPVSEITGRGGFFWWDYNFILMPIGEQLICGIPDDTALAHEIGHYLGLGNTFASSFADMKAAEEAYTNGGYQLTAFDGDAFSDTPPDLFVQAAEYQCGSDPSILLNGMPVVLPRKNLMSYYPPREILTPQQTFQARYWLAYRVRNEMKVATNYGITNPIEMETIPIKEYRWSTSQVEDMKGYSARKWSGSKHLDVVAGYGSALLVEFSVDKEGIYDLTLYGTTSPDYGILEVEVDEVLVNDYVDLYSPFPFVTGPIGMSPYYLTPGTHEMLFKVVKKNDLSTGFNFGLDAITVEMRK